MMKRHSHQFHVEVFGRHFVHRFTHRHELRDLSHVHRVGQITDQARYYDEEAR